MYNKNMIELNSVQVLSNKNYSVKSRSYLYLLFSPYDMHTARLYVDR